MHKFDCHFIMNMALFDRLKAYEEKLDPSYELTLDLETNSKEERLAQTYGIGLCFTNSTAFYIPIKTPNGIDIWNKENINSIYAWILSVSKKRGLIGWNIIYDVLVHSYNGGDILDEYIKADGILMKHLLDEEPPFGLKENAVSTLGDWADKAQQKLKDEVEQAGGKWTKDQKDMYLASTETLGEYCCWDVILTRLLFEEYAPRIEEEGLVDLFEEEVMPLYRECTISMKRKGFAIDVDYYEKLDAEITEDLKQLEEDMYNEVKEQIQPFRHQLLEKSFGTKKTGQFPKSMAECFNIPVPKTKSGKITLSKGALEKQKKATPQYSFFYDWVMDKEDADLQPLFNPAQSVLFFKQDMQDIKPIDVIRRTWEYMWEKKNGEDRVFNFRSNDHLAELFINIRGHKALEKTPTGKPKVDDAFIEHLAKQGDTVAEKLAVYKKLNKIQSTYIQGILERQIDGVIHTSMLQFGTTSGRYSSRNPNLQNLPRPIDDDKKSSMNALIVKYTDSIRAGFVAPKGYKIVDADYSALEPRCFAHMSGDERLRDVFRKGEDLYSRIAIDVFELKGISANPNDDNYLKKVQPSFRQQAKIFCLAVPYGAEASRISQEMNCSFQEAKKIINKYLNAYPDLKKYMHLCNYSAKTKGAVSTEFGRIRHLKEAKAIHTLYSSSSFDILDYKQAKKKGLLDQRRKFKNALNNAKNFRIQGLAAHIVNRAMIAIARAFKTHEIDGYVALQVHDQVCCVVKEEQLELACKLVQDCMENTTKISIPLIAEPEVADNLRDSH